MIKICSNLNEFLNIETTENNYELTLDSYVIKITDEFEELIAQKAKNSDLFVIGSFNLLPELVENMIFLGLKFETYMMRTELSKEFNKLYLEKMGGHFVEMECYDKGYVSAKYYIDNIQSCVLAGGCFWCAAKPYYEYEGVQQVYSGFSAGKEILPTYEEVKSQKTNHLESIKLIYDKTKISYKEILDIYFDTIDPFDAGGQYIDRGESYTTAIFYKDEKMKKEISDYIEKLEKQHNKKIVVKVLPETLFYMAEEYHQDFALKNPKLMAEELVSSGRIKK